MNRAERRALEFGRAFTLNRPNYNIVTHSVGIGFEMDKAWSEYCDNQPPCEHDDLWDYFFVEV